jgi:hypothetical protein
MCIVVFARSLVSHFMNPSILNLIDYEETIQI